MLVRIDSWESSSQYPNGHSVRVLGRAGELETEIQTVLIENGIHLSPFSDAQVRRVASERTTSCFSRGQLPVSAPSSESCPAPPRRGHGGWTQPRRQRAGT